MASLVLAVGIHAAAQAHGTPLSVCQLRASPHKYLKKLVTVSGEVFQGHHTSTFNDPACEEGTAITESEPLYRSNSPLLISFREGRAMTYGCLDTRPFWVVVRGRFEIVKTGNMNIYRVVVVEVLSSEFRKGVSKYCLNVQTPVPPPDVKFPLQPLPNLLMPEVPQSSRCAIRR